MKQWDFVMNDIAEILMNKGFQANVVFCLDHSANHSDVYLMKIRMPGFDKKE